MAKSKETSALDTALSVAGIIVGIVGTAVTIYTYRRQSLTQQQLDFIAQLVPSPSADPKGSVKQNQGRSFDTADFRARHRTKS